MSRKSPLIIQKGGFFVALAYGFFGMLTAIIVCGAGVAFYALSIVDRKADQVMGIGHSMLSSLPEMQESLPSVLSDVLSDRRDPEYRKHVDLDVRMVSRDGGQNQVVIEATNNGTEMITLMAFRIVLVDGDDVPVQSFCTYAATPFTIDNEWRGPLMPGSTRRCGMRLYQSEPGLTPKVEITDLRVWNEQPPKVPAAPSLPSVAIESRIVPVPLARNPRN